MISSGCEAGSVLRRTARVHRRRAATALSVAALLLCQLTAAMSASPASARPSGGTTSGAEPIVTQVAIKEMPRRGQVTLTFRATGGEGGIAFTEFRINNRAWQCGTKGIVYRSGIAVRVRYRSVAGDGTVEPVRTWRYNWPGLRAAAYPRGGFWRFATYDWYRLTPLERWKLDHPVCLIFRSAGTSAQQRISLSDVVRALNALGFGKGFAADLLGRSQRGSDGGLAVGEGKNPSVDNPTLQSKGLKRSIGFLNTQSAYHVRIYAPQSGSFADAKVGSFLIGSCHTDVNEAMTVVDGRLLHGQDLPSGAADPGLGVMLLKYGGNSEWVEHWIASAWAQQYGAANVALDAYKIGDPQDWFDVQYQGSQNGKSWIMGKWWVSDGRATVLTLPKR